MESNSNSSNASKSGTQKDPLEIRDSEWKRMVFKDFSLEYFKIQEEYFFMGEHVLGAAKGARVKTPLQTLEKHLGSLDAVKFATKGLCSVPVLNYELTKKVLKLLESVEKAFPSSCNVLTLLKNKIEPKKETKHPKKKQKIAQPTKSKPVAKKEVQMTKPKKVDTTSTKKVEKDQLSNENAAEMDWKFHTFVQEWFENFVERQNTEEQERLRNELKNWKQPFIKNSSGKFFKVHAKDCLLHKTFDDVGLAEHLEFEELPCFYCDRIPVALLCSGEEVRMATKAQLRGAESTGTDIFSLDQDLLVVIVYSIVNHSRQTVFDLSWKNRTNK